jgi:hypothetical protein
MNILTHPDRKGGAEEAVNASSTNELFFGIIVWLGEMNDADI